MKKAENFKTTTYIAVLLATLSIAGCTLTRGSSVLVGTKRPAVSPATVKLYLQPPKRFEQVAIISADARNDFASHQNLTDNAVARLKEEAASVGANGVLIQGVENFQVGASGIATATNSPPYSVVAGASNVRLGKESKGIAIYVIEE